MDLKEIIKKFALKNALDYGKANPGAVVGKIIAKSPDAKKDMKNTMKLVNEIVSQINKMKKEEIEEEIKNYKFVEKKKEEKTLSLPNAEEGKVITRFPPEPSGYPHIGHAKAAFLDYESANIYKGKMLLRFDDTNPEKESQEYVDAIKEGLKWLGIKWFEESYTSDNIKSFYKYAEKMIEKDRAYVCTCSGDKIKENRAGSTPCDCRNLDPLPRWKKMLSGEYKKGEAILRLKGDLESNNTALRDPTLFRILPENHYRQKSKYFVWPSYDFVAPIMDSMEKVTHAMRTKEYELRNPLYFLILEILELRKPELIEFSRLQIKNAPISKRLITPLVKEKKVMGWDDPRLPTLSGLKRRGILPEAVKTFVLRFGLSKVESEPDWEMLLKDNRKLLDKISKHYFFVPDPVKIKIKNAPNNEIVYIPKADSEKGEIRLKDLFNIRITGKNSAEYLGDKLVPKKVQWVSEYIEAEVLIPGDLLKDDKYNPDSLELVKGYAQKECSRLNIGDIIQFERFGFCRLDKKNKNKLTFIFSC